ncbi:MAG: hypothetical protein M3Y28_03590, partial [Armatimonadota bacterium]|nr:hypothetical protein [Armatimonadota bacterium]
AKPRHVHYHSCQSNERIPGVAITQYEQDNDECLPNIAKSPGGAITWRSFISPYFNGKQRFQCPSRDDDESKTLGPDGFPRSYAANYSGNYDGTIGDQGQGAFAGPGAKAISFAELETPATLIMLCEVHDSNAPEFNIDDPARFGPAKHILWAGHTGPGNIHSANFLFANGHVKLLAPSETAWHTIINRPVNPVQRNLWYRDGTQPLSPTGVAILAEAEKSGADQP